MAVPWGCFWDAKNQKPPTFSRKIRGLRFHNLAVKERFEPASSDTDRTPFSIHAMTSFGRMRAIPNSRSRPKAFTQSPLRNRGESQSPVSGTPGGPTRPFSYALCLALSNASQLTKT